MIITTNGPATWGWYVDGPCLFIGDEPYTPASGVRIVTYTPSEWERLVKAGYRFGEKELCP